MKRKPYELLTEHNADRSYYQLRIRVREDPPDDFGVILSDTVHQFRATLDNIAFILAGRPKGKYARRVQFPIIHPGPNGGRKAFNDWAKSRLQGVKNAPLAIIESIQPYHGLRRPRPDFKPWPPYPLSVLEHLSNIDKHRAPHLTYVSPSRFLIETSADPIAKEFAPIGPLEDDAIVARYWFGEPNVYVKRPGAQLLLALDLPAYRKKGPLPILEYLYGVGGLIAEDIIKPLRPYLG